MYIGIIRRAVIAPSTESCKCLYVRCNAYALVIYMHKCMLVYRLNIHAGELCVTAISNVLLKTILRLAENNHHTISFHFLHATVISFYFLHATVRHTAFLIRGAEKP
jgi:hypothetical protein